MTTEKCYRNQESTYLHQCLAWADYRASLHLNVSICRVRIIEAITYTYYVPVVVFKSFVKFTHLILKATQSDRWAIIMHERANQRWLGDLTIGREFDWQDWHPGHKIQPLKHYAAVSWVAIDNTSKYKYLLR